MGSHRKLINFGNVEECVKKPTLKRKKPKWLKVQLPYGASFKKVRDLVDKHSLHTICQSGSCPNMGECWGAGTATFMILGNICTRSCRFCAVKTGRPSEVDWQEPQRVAQSVFLMQVKHCVITSVDRDDLKDGGASVWAETINQIKKKSPSTTLETLIPDFKGNIDNIKTVIDCKPEVVSHNIETVRKLTKQIRVQAKYDRSMECLDYISSQNVRTKSGMMLGLGEKKEEIIETMNDLRKIGVHILTLGQYLQPTLAHHPVMDWIKPAEFEYYKKIGLEMGFICVESGPLVRSSYHAEKHVFPIELIQ